MQIGLFLLLLFAAASLRAQARLELLCPESVEAEKTFMLVLRIENGSASTAPSVDWGADFELVQALPARKGTSYKRTGSEGGNQHSSASLPMEEHIFELRPRRAGKLRLPAISVQTQTGEKLQSKAQNISAVGGLGDILQMRLIPNKQKIQLGESLELELYFYYDPSAVAKPQNLSEKRPNIPDVFVYSDDRARGSSKTIEGKSFRFQRRMLIYPNKLGKFRIQDAGGMSYAGKLLDSDNPYAAAPTVEIEVEAPSSLPADFMGSTGDYEISASIEKSDISTDEPLKIIVKAEGRGDIKMLPLPQIVFDAAAFQALPPSIDDSSAIDSKKGSVWGTKTYTYLLTPLQTGAKTVSVTLSFYHTGEKKIVNRSFELSANISEGKNPITPIKTAPEPIEKANLIPLRAPLESSEWQIGGEKGTLAGAWWFWLICASLPAGALAARTYLNSTKEQRQERILSTETKAKASNQLEKAKTLLQANEAAGFYAEIAQALQQYAAQKYKIPLHTLTRDSLIATIKQHKGMETVANQLQTLLQTCDTALYGGGASGEEMQNTLAQATQIIKNL